MNGLILAGGHSKRMGQSKSMLLYEGQPQFLRVADLLQPVCNQVFISCRPSQQPDLLQAGWGSGFIMDSDHFGDIGPMNGLLSAFQHSTDAWLVVGCDYPFLLETDILSLCQSRSESALATAFVPTSTQIPEPLIAIYEASAATPLLQWLEAGNQSLRWFLGQIPFVAVAPDDDNRLISVDNWKMYEAFNRHT